MAPEGFYQYVPEAFVGEWRQSTWRPDERESAKPTVEQCNAARFQRVWNKEKISASRTVQIRLTGQNPPGALWKVIGAVAPALTVYQWWWATAVNKGLPVW